tara:strand:+ start:241 stop:459 length:219 start_codon:yes stop_codon:yes gene_type:complete
MKILGGLFLFLGWLLLVTTTFLWTGHGIYQLIKTDIGFWTVVSTNLFGWIVQGLVGSVFIGIGMTTASVQGK